MKVIKTVNEEIVWRIDEYCCEKMEHAKTDELILINDGQVKFNHPSRSAYLKDGDFVDYCPFCGEKIEVMR